MKDEVQGQSGSNFTWIAIPLGIALAAITLSAVNGFIEEWVVYVTQ